MGKRMMLLTLLLAASVAALGQSGGGPLKPDANTERELRALRRDFMDAIKRGDRDALERILADGFTLVHSTGVMETRGEYIDRAVAGAQSSQAGSKSSRTSR